MRKTIMDKLEDCRAFCDGAVWRMRLEWNKAKCFWRTEEPGVDGILVTVGLCIIALLLCVVMKDSLTTFIETIVTEMTEKAKTILTTTTTTTVE